MSRVKNKPDGAEERKENRSLSLLVYQKAKKQKKNKVL